MSWHYRAGVEVVDLLDGKHHSYSLPQPPSPRRLGGDARSSVGMLPQVRASSLTLTWGTGTWVILLDPQRATERPGSIVRFRTVVIHENRVEAAITKERTAELSDS